MGPLGTCLNMVSVNLKMRSQSLSQATRASITDAKRSGIGSWNCEPGELASDAGDEASCSAGVRRTTYGCGKWKAMS